VADGILDFMKSLVTSARASVGRDGAKEQAINVPHQLDTGPQRAQPEL
jgi:hypothetical protein